MIAGPRRTFIGALLALGLLLPVPDARAVPGCSPEIQPRVVLGGQGRLESLVFDSNGRLFFTDLAGNRLLRVAGPGAPPQFLTAVQAPGGLVFDDDGRLLMGYGNNAQNGLGLSQAGLLKVDPDSGASSTYATGLAMANGVARGHDGAIYASNDFGDDIDRIRNGQVQRRWAAAQSANGLVVDSRGRYLYAAQTFKPPTIARAEIARPGIVTEYAAGEPGDATAGLDGMTRDQHDRLFVAANGSGQVWRVGGDRRPCVLARGLTLPSAVAFGNGGGFPSTSLYVTTFAGQIVELPGARPPPTSGSRSQRRRIRLLVQPRRVVGGRRTRFRFRALVRRDEGGRQALPAARIRFAGRRLRTNRRGRSRTVLRLRRVGRHRVTVRCCGLRPTSTRIFVARRRGDAKNNLK